jgi:hypothetical protein
MISSIGTVLPACDDRRFFMQQPYDERELFDRVANVLSTR